MRTEIFKGCSLERRNTYLGYENLISSIMSVNVDERMSRANVAAGTDELSSVIGLDWIGLEVSPREASK